MPAPTNATVAATMPPMSAGESLPLRTCCGCAGCATCGGGTGAGGGSMRLGCSTAGALSGVCAVAPDRVTSASIDWKNCANCGSARSPVQRDRSAACRRRNSSGIFTSSMTAGISTLRRMASAASVFTHVDAAEACDHNTTTHFAASSASSITSSNCFPGGMMRSHHTDQPCSASTSARSLARSRSALA